MLAMLAHEETRIYSSTIVVFVPLAMAMFSLVAKSMVPRVPLDGQAMNTLE
jgi:hypothetical protein